MFACVRLKQVSLVTLLATSLSVFVGCQRQMVIPSGASEGQSEAVLPGFEGVVCLATLISNGIIILNNIKFSAD